MRDALLHGSVAPVQIAPDGSVDTDGVVAYLDLDAVGDERIDELVRTVPRSGRVTVGVATEPLRSAHVRLLAALTVTVAERPAGAGPTVVAVPDGRTALARIERTIACAPRASVTLAAVLRVTERLPVEEALVTESLAYSTLLAGPEFAHWLAARAPARHDRDPGNRVAVARDGQRLTITLTRPGSANAYDRAMRDALIEALELAVLDPTIEIVELRAEGSHFCAGGDLAEFGTAPDPATAHLVRMSHSAGLLMHRVAARSEVRVHGACIGAGVELAAFAGRVLATSDATFSLPEVAMGLIPGAGGTVSLPRRIGRWRTAYLALSGAPLDAETALDWDLVDALV